MSHVRNEVVRSSDRVHYLKNPDEVQNGLQIDNLRVRVYRWTAEDLCSHKAIRLSLEASPFDVSQAMTAEQARVIAGALLAAAEEADAAEVHA